MIKNFNDFLIMENDAPRKFGCLMLQFDDSGWKEEVESMVPYED